MSKDKNTWTWLGHAAHLIVASKCQFHMATELGNGIIVSTIGEYWPERSSREIHAKIYDEEWHAQNNHLKGDIYDAAYMKRFGFEEIGADRRYETMVFKSSPAGDNCDACPFIIESGHNYDFDNYAGAGEAYKGHMAMCDKWADKTVAELVATDE